MEYHSLSLISICDSTTSQLASKQLNVNTTDPMKHRNQSSHSTTTTSLETDESIGKTPQIQRQEARPLGTCVRKCGQCRQLKHILLAECTVCSRMMDIDLKDCKCQIHTNKKNNIDYLICSTCNNELTLDGYIICANRTCQTLLSGLINNENTTDNQETNLLSSNLTNISYPKSAYRTVALQVNTLINLSPLQRLPSSTSLNDIEKNMTRDFNSNQPTKLALQSDDYSDLSATPKSPRCLGIIKSRKRRDRLSALLPIQTNETCQTELSCLVDADKMISSEKILSSSAIETNQSNKIERQIQVNTIKDTSDDSFESSENDSTNSFLNDERILQAITNRDGQRWSEFISQLIHEHNNLSPSEMAQQLLDTIERLHSNGNLNSLTTDQLQRKVRYAMSQLKHMDEQSYLQNSLKITKTNHSRRNSDCNGRVDLAVTVRQIDKPHPNQSTTRNDPNWKPYVDRLFEQGYSADEIQQLLQEAAQSTGLYDDRRLQNVYDYIKARSNQNEDDISSLGIQFLANTTDDNDNQPQDFSAIPNCPNKSDIVLKEMSNKTSLIDLNGSSSSVKSVSNLDHEESIKDLSVNPIEQKQTKESSKDAIKSVQDQEVHKSQTLQVNETVLPSPNTELSETEFKLNRLMNNFESQMIESNDFDRDKIPLLMNEYIENLKKEKKLERISRQKLTDAISLLQEQTKVTVPIKIDRKNPSFNQYISQITKIQTDTSESVPANQPSPANVVDSRHISVNALQHLLIGSTQHISLKSNDFEDQFIRNQSNLIDVSSPESDNLYQTANSNDINTKDSNHSQSSVSNQQETDVIQLEEEHAKQIVVPRRQKSLFEQIYQIVQSKILSNQILTPLKRLSKSEEQILNESPVKSLDLDPNQDDTSQQSFSNILSPNNTPNQDKQSSSSSSSAITNEATQSTASPISSYSIDQSSQQIEQSTATDQNDASSIEDKFETPADEYRIRTNETSNSEMNIQSSSPSNTDEHIDKLELFSAISSKMSTLQKHIEQIQLPITSPRLNTSNLVQLKSSITSLEHSNESISPNKTPSLMSTEENNTKSKSVDENSVEVVKDNELYTPTLLSTDKSVQQRTTSTILSPSRVPRIEYDQYEKVNTPSTHSVKSVIPTPNNVPSIKATENKRLSVTHIIIEEPSEATTPVLDEHTTSIDDSENLNQPSKVPTEDIQNPTPFVSQTSFNSKNTELNADNQKTSTESRSESEQSISKHDSSHSSSSKRKSPANLESLIKLLPSPPQPKSSENFSSSTEATSEDEEKTPLHTIEDNKKYQEHTDKQHLSPLILSSDVKQIKSSSTIVTKTHSATSNITNVLPSTSKNLKKEPQKIPSRVSRISNKIKKIPSTTTTTTTTTTSSSSLFNLVALTDITSNDYHERQNNKTSSQSKQSLFFNNPSKSLTSSIPKILTKRSSIKQTSTTAQSILPNQIVSITDLSRSSNNTMTTDRLLTTHSTISDQEPKHKRTLKKPIQFSTSSKKIQQNQEDITRLFPTHQSIDKKQRRRKKTNRNSTKLPTIEQLSDENRFPFYRPIIRLPVSQIERFECGTIGPYLHPCSVAHQILSLPSINERQPQSFEQQDHQPVETFTDRLYSLMSSEDDQDKQAFESILNWQHQRPQLKCDEDKFRYMFILDKPTDSSVVRGKQYPILADEIDMIDDPNSCTIVNEWAFADLVKSEREKYQTSSTTRSEQLLNSNKRIKIFLQKRSLTQFEENILKEVDIISVVDRRTILLHIPSITVDNQVFVKNRKFKCDQTFDQNSPADTLYQSTLSPLIDKAINGNKCLCFIGGGKYSGKTYLLRSLVDLFAMDLMKLFSTYDIYIKFLGICHNRMIDILQNYSPIRLVKSLNWNLVPNHEFHIANSDDLECIINQIKKRRRFLHQIIEINFLDKEKPKTIGSLMIIVLASSQYVYTRNLCSHRRKFLINSLNKTILSFKRALIHLRQNPEQIRTAFNNDLLTRLIQPYIFHDQSYVSYIGTLNPGHRHRIATKSTLDFARNLRFCLKRIRKNHRRQQQLNVSPRIINREIDEIDEQIL